MDWLENGKDALVAMAELYISVQILDLAGGKVYPVKSDDAADEILQTDKKLQERLEELAEQSAVRDSSRQALADFINLDTLPERLQGTNRTSLVVHCKEKGWCRLDFIRMGNEEPVTRVIFAVEDITSQKEHESLMQQTVDLLAECYSAIYYVNLRDQTVEPVRMNEIAKYVVGSQTEKLTPRLLMKTYIDSFVHPADAAEMMRLVDLDYLQKRLEKEPCLVHLYRTHKNGIDTHFRLKIMKLAHRQILVCAFENIDKEVEEKCRTAQEREQYNMLIHGLSQEYSSVWYIDADRDIVSLVRSNATSTTTKKVLDGVKEGSYEQAIRSYIDAFVVPEDRERLYQQTSIVELRQHIYGTGGQGAPDL